MAVGQIGYGGRLFVRAAGDPYALGGPPFVPDLDNNYVQVIQANDHVVLLTERRARIVPLDGRPHLTGNLRSWAGDSRGHWEGETLVVETSNFNNRTRSFAGAGTSSQEKVITERRGLHRRPEDIPGQDRAVLSDG